MEKNSMVSLTQAELEAVAKGELPESAKSRNGISSVEEISDAVLAGEVKVIPPVIGGE